MLRTTLRTIVRNTSYGGITSRCASSVAAPAAKKSRFDKSVVKPLLVLVVFGSVLTNVMEERRKYSDMERRYQLKINKLEELIERANVGEKNLDIAAELKIIDALFKVSQNQRYTGIIGNTKHHNGPSTPLKSKQDNEESLEDIWQELVSSLEEDELKLKREQELNKAKLSNELVTDKQLLKEQKKKEELEKNLVPSHATHTIVSTPGEVSEAAKDTSLKRFV
ncbi:uncharacterized protein GVI51_F06369 [Nakaseomyces glabratus]|uniref:Inner membrane assembly complex subunit 22 n=2 Tax=Candida glabrata TaxID=5478 RepID=Q6FU32_CANGA|nr:uncharacterized protein CAGL0F06765g [Nakaseomyces glabratus]KAH7605222.1 hypothetical protein J7294_01515 [Nakaseomyces glabratus]KAH7607152.1 hypothetical protein J7293_01511 [Nakaseomyces glabratus]KTB00274.1 Inner membrane assembly complex subunit 22 [Nakaseomyces glabratus]KTB02804.1 Inner membrane assembly complex subunit 22 [Nakaseomyces glabratus]KTB05020.1 Inner membrane assembly complex subunit 22 [Nakaseomyces glabratus]|eukprot:XP_446262.1 uncharacterized protein CAGL0F06765g [[Candida] glabrata]